MNEKLKEYRPIISLIEKRESLNKERAELDAAASDPNRLLSKSSNQAARLLKEEKLRKTIAKDLPKIEENLKKVSESRLAVTALTHFLYITQTLAAWEKQYDQPFMWGGRRYLETLDAELEADRRRKEDDRARRETLKAARAYGTISNRENIPRDLKTPTKPMAGMGAQVKGTLKTPATAVRTPGIREQVWNLLSELLV